MTADIVTLPRQEFLEHYWDYRAGEHVTFLGPTGSGKTHLKWQLLSYTATPEVPATVLATKPKDATTKRWSKTLGYATTRTWPPVPNPVRRMFHGKPRGRVLWPAHTFDPDRDDANHYRQFSTYLRDAYKRGNQIVDVDEMLDMVDLDLERECRTLWTRGRSMGAGLWAGTQQPFHIPTHAYRQCEHLFIAKDPDRRSQQRYDEIGGFDPGLLRSWVMSLDKHQFLYARRSGPVVCVVDK